MRYESAFECVKLELLLKRLDLFFKSMRDNCELRGGFLNEIICNSIEMNGLVFNLKLCD